jgi:DNA polymerase-4
MAEKRSRLIAHVDLNNFYAGVECMLDTSLRDQAVAVCGSVEERHGIVLAKNDKAKTCGVKTGEAVWQAKSKCKNLVTVPPHFERYMKYSRLARQIYERYTDRIEPYGIDECWLDLTGSAGLFGSGEKMCDEIRAAVRFELGLTVSVGLSFNKIFAKLGSDMKKPDALTVIPEETFREKLWGLPTREMLGVGGATEKILTGLGIRTIGDLARIDPKPLSYRLKSRAYQLHQWANGKDVSAVLHKDAIVPVKSVGHGITALQDLENGAEVWRMMLALCQEIGHKLRKYGKKAGGVSIAIKDNTLFSKEWQHKIPIPTMSASVIAKEAYDLFARSYQWANPIRAVTVTAIDLCEKEAPFQVDLFNNAERVDRQETLDAAIDWLRERFGNGIVQNGCLLQDIKMQKDEMRTVLPTGTVTLMGGI